MLKPICEQTEKLFAPLNLAPTDRLAISLAKEVADENIKTERDVIHYGEKFIVNIYGAAITQEEYRTNYNYLYSNRVVPDSKNPGKTKNIYFARPSNIALREFVQRIPERKKVLNDYDNYRGERFEFAATDITVSLIHKLWKRENIAFTDEAKRVFDYLLITSMKMDENAKIISDYKINKIVPECDLQFCAEKPLSPYQQVALYLQNKNDGFASFMEQGTGKTPPSIANIDNLAEANWQKQLDAGKKNPDALKVLILCPNNVRANWENEFKNFSTVDGRIAVLRGTEMERLRTWILTMLENTYITQLNQETGDYEKDLSRPIKYIAIICGYDILHRFEPLLKLQWDAVFADESQYFKSADTKRWKDGLLKLRERSKRRYVLTGTPVCNSVNDLWTQLEFLRKGGSGFISFKNYQNFYSVYDEFSRRVGYQNLPFLQERLSQMAFFITKKEALPDLPDKVYRIVECEMSTKQAQVYRDIADKLHHEIELELENSKQVDSMTVNNILTQLLRLAQITSGFVTYDEVVDDNGVIIKPKKVVRFDGPDEQPKIKELIEILKEKQPDEKTIIWACFESDLLSLQESLEEAGFRTVLFYGKTTENQRKQAEYDFNHDDNCKIFIGNAAAGGTGLNLLGYPPQHPELSDCDVTEEIFYSQNWSAMYRAQSEDRAHRRGTRRNVTITDLQVPNTIDTEIRKRVVEKREDASTIADLREVLNSILKMKM